MKKPSFELHIYSFMFVGTVNRIDKPIKNQAASLSKQDLNKICADQRSLLIASELK